jgi:hypothetical protein
MFERILRRFRERIRATQFVVTLHAVEELEDEGLSVFDVEHAFLTGKIAGRQRDAETGEWKYHYSLCRNEPIEPTGLFVMSVVGRVLRCVTLPEAMARAPAYL